MISRWYEYKNQAIQLRLDGKSIRNIENQLHIPRSTLSGWFKDIKLTDSQRQELRKSWLKRIAKGRKKAVVWHNEQKQIRIFNAKTDADLVLNNIDTNNKYILELALSMLYLGEGSKDKQTSMGNSNPEVVKFFVKCLYIIYDISPLSLKCYLHLRSDQDGEKLKRFWSRETKIPFENFSFTLDKRTVKSKTYPNYKGVCVVHCGNIALLRRMAFLSHGFCGKILEYQGD